METNSSNHPSAWSRTAKWPVPVRAKTALVLIVADGHSQILFEVSNMELSSLIVTFGVALDC